MGRPRLFPDGFDRDPRVEGTSGYRKHSKPAGLSKSVQTRGLAKSVQICAPWGGPLAGRNRFTDCCFSIDFMEKCFGGQGGGRGTGLLTGTHGDGRRGGTGQDGRTEPDGTQRGRTYQDGTRRTRPSGRNPTDAPVPGRNRPDAPVPGRNPADAPVPGRHCVPPCTDMNINTRAHLGPHLPPCTDVTVLH